MSNTVADGMRTRLAAIADEIRTLADDDLARRHDLLTEADACRNALTAEVDTDAAAKKWAERAGRKGSHEPDYEAREAMIAVTVPDSGSTA